VGGGLVYTDLSGNLLLQQMQLQTPFSDVIS
jgi:hypothetical protein